MRRSDVLAVMKPKDITVKDIVSLVPDAARALEAGRVVVLDRDTYVSEVARHSDIVVGLGISTAGVEAAMLGVPAVHYDPSMRVNAQMHERAKHTIVFSELEPLLEELDRFADGTRDSSTGNHAGVIEEIDPFRDGNAAGRIGVYLTNYVVSLEGGFDRDQALDAANQVYMARWGTDKVSVSSLQDT
jgi:hypothetical protein